MSTTELVATGQHATGGGALALRPDQTTWTPAQEAALAQLGLAEAPDGDRMVFLHQCQRTGLDPFARQIYMIKRQEQGRDKWTIQTGIDGFRAVAEEHDEYEGQDDIEFCGPDGQWTTVWLDPTAPPAAARCAVYRSDKRRAITATVLFREFAQYRTWNGEQVLTSMWKTKGAWMLGKCAEAAALRKAFPQRLSGIYTEDEAGAFERSAQTTAVPSQRATPGAVTDDELAGAVVHEAVADPPVATDSPSSAAGTARSAPPAGEGPRARSGGGGERMTAAQSRQLFPLIRKAQVGDRNEWASRVLGREVTSFGAVSEDDAAALIENAEQLVAAAAEDETADAEVVEEPTGGS